MARMSGSRLGSRSIAARSARSFSLDWKASIAATTGSSSLSSRDSAEYCGASRALGEARGDFLVATEDEIEIVVGGHV